MVDVIRLTQNLISFNTFNPPGNERIIAEFVGKLLSENGFEVKYPLFAKNRLHVVAERGLPNKTMTFLELKISTDGLLN